MLNMVTKEVKISKIMFRSKLGKTVIFLKDQTWPLYQPIVIGKRYQHIGPLAFSWLLVTNLIMTRDI